MNIYFAASIAGGRAYLETYRLMVGFLQEQGHRVLTEHIIADDVLQQESHLTAEQIYRRDMEWLANCDAFIAEISNPSLGVGYEICMALNRGKKVLCLYQKGLFISRMIIGNDRLGLTIAEYATTAEWQDKICQFLANCSKRG